eukprot:GGOE01021566.1.p3 GENE.GGOE01021566.1~~GGOE01021566.1.p3  ORF type:complete len:302 (+),score=63.25 GGOE01021566.1:782-1687(+)
MGVPKRYHMVLAYDGRAFFGWERQGPQGRPTVQWTVEAAARALLQQRVRVCSAGRTDSGVSALAQVCQFDAVTTLAPEVLLEELNQRLPPTVRVKSLGLTSLDFCAMHCQWKRYAYTIPPGVDWQAVQLPAPRYRIVEVLQDMLSARTPPATEAAAATSRTAASPSIGGPGGPGLDVAAMQRAAASLLGTHDFASFQAAGGRVSTVRTLHACDVSALEDGSIRIALVADGFLYKMARILSGVLVEVGCGRKSEDSVRELLASPSHNGLGLALPGQGLCLEHVEYDMPWDAWRCKSDCNAAP